MRESIRWILVGILLITFWVSWELVSGIDKGSYGIMENEQEGEESAEEEDLEEKGDVSRQVASSGDSVGPSNSLSRGLVDRAVPDRKGRSLEQYMTEEFSAAWSFQRGEQGEIYRVSGDVMALPESKSERDRKLQKLAREMAGGLVHYDVELSELSSKEQMEMGRRSFQQQCKGLDVFKGVLAFMLSSDGRSLTLINLNLFDFDCERILLEELVDIAAAKQHVSENVFPGRAAEVRSMVRASPYLVIWAPQKDTVRVAYRFHVTVGQPSDYREVLVDAHTLAVLVNRTLKVF